MENPMPRLRTGCEDDICLPLFLAARNCNWSLTSVQGTSLGSWDSSGRPNCPLQEHHPLQGQCSCRSQRWNPAVFTTVHVNSVRASLLCCHAEQWCAGDLLGLPGSGYAPRARCSWNPDLTPHPEHQRSDLVQSSFLISNQWRKADNPSS